MDHKHYIDDFVEDLNYRNVILYVKDVDLDLLFNKLKKDNVSHLYRFDIVRENYYLYIENCDLQTVDFGIEEYFDEDYTVMPLHYDGRFYTTYPIN